MTAPGTRLVAEVLQTPGGTLIIRSKAGNDLKLSLAAVTRRQADGSFVIEPLGTWITVGEAARLIVQQRFADAESAPPTREIAAHLGWIHWELR